MKTFTLVVSLKISEDYYKDVIFLSQKIRKNKDVIFSLEDDPNRAHISLYVGVFPLKNKELIVKKVEEILLNNKTKINLKISELKSKNRFVSIGFDLDNNLYKLHEDLVLGLNDLRESFIKTKYTDEKILLKLTKSETINLNKYGYPYSLENFIPHLTLVKFEDESDALFVIDNKFDVSHLNNIDAEKIEILIKYEKLDDRVKEKMYFNLI